VAITKDSQPAVYQNQSNYLKYRDVPTAIYFCCWWMSPCAFVLMALKNRLTLGVFEAKFTQEQFW